MDSRRQPPPPAEQHLQLPSLSSSSRNPRRRPGSPSRSIATPPSPAAVPDPSVEYFPTLTEEPSTRSYVSRPSSRRSSNASVSGGYRPGLNEGRLSSIRIRRSNASLSSASNDQLVPNVGFNTFDGAHGGRPRSISQPERAHVPDNAGLARHSRKVPQIAMPRLTEEGNRPSAADLGLDTTSPISPTRSLPEHTTSPIDDPYQNAAPGGSRLQRGRLSRFFWPGHRRQADNGEALPPQNQEPGDEYGQELVDWLDMIDPEVQTLSTLTNVQNSLFIPDLGKFINRRPTYVLSQHGPEQEWAKGALAEERRRAGDQGPADSDADRPPIERTSTISSRLTESHYAALPHGTNLEGWSAAEKKELDDHVRHMLHSRRARFKRRMKGFGQYVRRPLGFFVTLYATLITLFGLAWVLFLIGWIYVGEKQVYAIHIIDSVLVALFAIMGDGLAPFRAVDTYHMFFIARYTRMITNAEKGKMPRARLQKRSIPDEVRESLDANGGRITSSQAREILRASGPRIPVLDESGATVPNQMPDIESAKSSESEHDLPALTYKQLKSLQHHQKKFAKSHSFYKPHETFTHHSFPLAYLITIVILLDCHSLLQISLGACTWGIDYHTRPFAITTVILCVSITCNITAGLVISRGDRKTRKKEVMELINRQELTGDAIKHIEEKKKKKQEKEDKGKDSEKEGNDQQSSGSSVLVKSPT